jgi:hypothetical protein
MDKFTFVSFANPYLKTGCAAGGGYASGPTSYVSAAGAGVPYYFIHEVGRARGALGQRAAGHGSVWAMGWAGLGWAGLGWAGLGWAGPPSSRAPAGRSLVTGHWSPRPGVAGLCMWRSCTGPASQPRGQPGPKRPTWPPHPQPTRAHARPACRSATAWAWTTPTRRGPSRPRAPRPSHRTPPRLRRSGAAARDGRMPRPGNCSIGVLLST